MRWFENKLISTWEERRLLNMRGKKVVTRCLPELSRERSGWGYCQPPLWNVASEPPHSSDLWNSCKQNQKNKSEFEFKLKNDPLIKYSMGNFKSNNDEFFYHGVTTTATSAPPSLAIFCVSSIVWRVDSHPDPANTSLSLPANSRTYQKEKVQLKIFYFILMVLDHFSTFA